MTEASGAKKATGQAKEAVEKMGDQMRASAERMTATGTELGMRLLDQAEENTRQAFAAMRAAAQARDVNEVMRIQSDFLREQSSRAMAQATEIGELITSYGRDAIGQMTGKS